MRIAIVICFAALIFASSGAAPWSGASVDAQKPAEPQKPAKDAMEPRAKLVAAAWFEALAESKMDVALTLSAVPFAMDGKEVLITRRELKAFYDGVAKKKGSRRVPDYKVEAVGKKKEIVDEVYALAYTVVEIKLSDDDESIRVCVRSGDDPKVVGFRD